MNDGVQCPVALMIDHTAHLMICQESSLTNDFMTGQHAIVTNCILSQRHRKVVFYAINIAIKY